MRVFFERQCLSTGLTNSTNVMTPLRLRMIEDMRTAGLASGTQALYLDTVRNLKAYVSLFSPPTN